ncbi:MAG: insulinase family protein [Lactobacillales bacterium]|nr:insulinase family protein [Lactobacillales bacterium]
MEKFEYARIGERFFQERLSNGLQVYLIPKKNFNKTYAIFTTNFGSIDNEFIPIGERKSAHFPDGIAHFLEHKLFEKEDGDVFQKFGKLGSSANAFTGFTRTSYLFSTTSKVKKNLEVLLDFVQDPYFTEETVKREKGIIAQEIQMYQDDADWRLFFGMLENLYPETSLSRDIAGTVESIEEITSEMLYQSYYNFYHPSNMILVLAGSFDAREIMTFIKENQIRKEFVSIPILEDKNSSLRDMGVISDRTLEVNVVRPKFALGLKGRDIIGEASLEYLRYKFSLKMFFQMLFGSLSQNFLKLYKEGLVDNSFSYDFVLDRGYHFAEISGDVNDPKKVMEILQEILANYHEQEDFNEGMFHLVKKQIIGKWFQSLNSLEAIANNFSQGICGVQKEVLFFETPSLVGGISFEDFQCLVKKFMDKAKITFFSIIPKIKK